MKIQDTEENQDILIDFEDTEDENSDSNEEKTENDYSALTSDDSVKAYLQQIGKIPLLSAEEELEYAKNIEEKKCKKSREKLIRANLRLVVSIAKKYIVTPLSGYSGLIIAQSGGGLQTYFRKS